MDIKKNKELSFCAKEWWKRLTVSSSKKSEDKNTFSYSDQQEYKLAVFLEGNLVICIKMCMSFDLEIWLLDLSYGSTKGRIKRYKECSL